MNCRNCKKSGCSLAGKNHEMMFDCKSYIGNTNADHIRNMADEELAELFQNLCCPYSLGGKVDCNIENLGCGVCWLSWLKSPVNKEGDI